MTKKPKPFTARPAPGQALLDYQRRVAPKVSVPLFDAEVIERAGKQGAANNFLLHSDCLPACAWLHSQNIAVDLVYIDPPFASGANYAKTLLLRGAKLEGSASIGEEVLYGDIWQKEDYLNWLYERLLAIREVMSENASIYVHLDWHIGHYVKVLLDEVFGESNFRNDIIWSYGGRGGKADSGQFPRNHDMIMWYSKGEDAAYQKSFITNTIPISDARAHGLILDDSGRWFSHAPRGHYTDESVQSLEKEGRIYRNGNGTIRIKYFHQADDKNIYVEKLVGDVWSDIPDAMHLPKSEKTAYPTQKPEALLRRIIEASSNEGDIVADFFCGSGTTAKVAHDNGRRFIACDIGMNGVQTSRDRLIKIGASFDMLKIKTGLHLFRNPEQTEKLIMSLIPGWEDPDKAGIGNFWDGGIANNEGDYTPIKVIGIRQKLTMQIIGEVLNAAGQTGANAITIVYANKTPDICQSKVNKEAKNHQHSNCTITLKSFDELLGDKAEQLTPEDSADIGAKTTTAKNGKKECRIQIRRFFSPRLNAIIDEHNTRLLGKGKIVIDDKGLELIDSVQFDLQCGEVWQSDQSLEDKAPSNKTIKGEYAVPAAAFRIKIRNITGDETLYACTDGKTITQL